MKTKNLTIIEAIQSGLPLRRPTWVNYVKARELSSCGIGDSDVLATDWEIKAPEVTITREKLAAAWFQIGPPFKRPEECHLFQSVCNKLGL